jgi:hypothetical protein
MWGPASLVYNRGATSVPGQPFTFPYVMTYDITPNNGNGGVDESTALAYSSDCRTWTRYGIVTILAPEGNPYSINWDNNYRWGGQIVMDDIGLYHMFYTGSAQYVVTDLYYAHGIGHAISRDGVTWSPDPLNPIFYYNNGQAWRAGATYTPMVIYDSFGAANGKKIWKMWFTGNAGIVAGTNVAIGYATASLV